MKNLGIVTFDIIRENEPEIAFSVASILAYLKNNDTFNEQCTVKHCSINLNKTNGVKIDWEQIELDWEGLDFIAISCYVWSHNYALELMEWIKEKKLNTKIILGGYQINQNNEANLKSMYPYADHFILGYAEESLVQIITGKSTNLILKKEIDFNSIPSPYTSGIIKLNPSIRKIRIETKRGCPFQCNFCAQHDLEQSKTKFHLKNRIIEELHLFKEHKIDRVSVTDPVFNMGKDYLEYLKTIKTLGMNTQFNFQIRPELIAKKNDWEFIELISDTNSEIELGLQTLDKKVNEIIKRGNKYPSIEIVIKELIKRNINFGISLIFGLPLQTLKSFEKDIKQLKDWGVKNLVAYPLMILPGTELYNKKSQFDISEKGLGDYNIKYVIKSNSFTTTEWEKMHQLAMEINPNERLF